MTCYYTTIHLIEKSFLELKRAIGAIVLSEKIEVRNITSYTVMQCRGTMYDIGAMYDMYDMPNTGQPRFPNEVLREPDLTSRYTI